MGGSHSDREQVGCGCLEGVGGTGPGSPAAQ